MSLPAHTLATIQRILDAEARRILQEENEARATNADLVKTADDGSRDESYSQ